MKSLVLFSAISLYCMASEAQTSKGSIMLGGSAGYNSSNSRSGNDNPNFHNSSLYKYWSVSPQFGFFVRDRLAIGTTMNYGRLKQVYTYDNELPFDKDIHIQENASVNLFARKYMTLSPNVSFFTGLSAGGGPSRTRHSIVVDGNENDPGMSRGYSVGMQAEGGVAYFPSKHIGLHAGIGGIGASYHRSRTSDTVTDYLNLNANLSSLVLNFGLSYFWGK
jgi:hypothetical protein